MEKTKMIEVYRAKTLDGQVPQMNDYYRNVYSNVQYKNELEGSVSVLVPEDEVQARKEFNNKCMDWLKRLEKENSVLAHKLASWHNIRLR
ncbi:hypothetical protein [Bacillus toyonensis]|uniref:hypothetical protein n=1 Tax=Bacillus toyonensis TaxID=155322 RepID=UPI000BFD1818|nr:hypothetical protein [Bacillus toyonensis]PHG57709.1 hypothetical protein COI59_29290 [Bacillus toyonensis]